MKMKYIALISVFVVVSLLFTTCRNENIDNMSMTDKFVQGFIVENSKPLTEILTKTYELKELKSFFGEIPPNENLMYGLPHNKSNLSINDVNEKFPIECLRLNHYVVYKVNEGGYFYVFWSLFIDDTVKKEEAEHSIEYVNNASVYFTAYLSPSSFKKEKDFDSIREGVSTAEDVSRIDPAFELSFLMSSGIRSYSLLENGSVMEIWYENSDKIESREDLLVKSKNILPKENGSSVSKLASIFPKDLP